MEIQKGSHIVKLFLAIGLFAISQSTSAQVQLVGSISSSHFLGDLGGKGAAGTPGFSDINIASTRYAVSAGARLHITPFVAFKMMGYYGRLSANDKYTSYIPRKNRNLNFFTPIYGGNLMLEGHFGFGKEANKRFILGTGVEYFFFNPMTKYNGNTVELQPLGTEGQNFTAGKKPYELHSWAIPVSMGYKFYYFPTGFLSVEVCARKTYTDYLDDASTTYPDKAQLLASDGQMAVDLSDRSLGIIQGFSEPGSVRASSTYNDNFFFISFSYTRNLGGKRTFSHSNRKREPKMGRGKNKCYSF